MSNAREAPVEVSPLAGKPATPAMLVDVPSLVTAYYAETPDFPAPEQRVAFGTSGHRGSAFESTFNQWHVLAISQALCDYRQRQGIGGPLFLGIDTHALSMPACASALEVLAANGVDVMLAERDEYTPTPAVSHAILTYNRGRIAGFADGIVVTPSHNPPDNGGFKWFVDGLLDGSLGFGGEESAGATFLRLGGAVWTTDKDGIVPALLSAEITARMGRDPGEIYRELTREFGECLSDRVEASATPEQKRKLSQLSPQRVLSRDLAGEKILSVLSHAPGNGAPIGGLKVIAENGWFAARPSGTENIYKIYVESFRGDQHLQRIKDEAQAIVDKALAAGAPADFPGRTADEKSVARPIETGK